MRVGLDGQALVGAIPTGFGVYAELVERALEGLAESEPGFSFEVFRPLPVSRPLATALQRLRWERWQLPAMIRKATRDRRLDLFHSPCLGAPANVPVPVVATVHDLLMSGARVQGRLSRWYFGKVVPAGWRRASLLITDTETVKDQLASECSLPRERIVVVALTSRYYGCEKQKERTGPPWVFLLVGTHEPRKNFAVAVKALSGLPEAMRRQSRLHIVGQRTGHTAELVALLEQLHLTEWVRFAGYQSEGELAATYRGSTALVFPSTAEGFGLPPLEAMSLGVPVLLSDIPVHREVYAEAEGRRNPGFFDLQSPQQLAELMQRVVEDDEFRAQLVSFGDAMSNSLNPQRFRARLLAAYHRTLST